MDNYILKKDGTEELFDENKIKTSLLNAGTEPAVAEATTSNIKKHLTRFIKSEDIYKIAVDHLRKNQPDAAIKYTLKKAIMDLGPTGYVFEKYMAAILNAQGYRTEVSRIVKGFCVDHEVDIVAEKNGYHFLVECKYHNDPGTKSDVKTALYIFARFLDIKNACEAEVNTYNFSEAWLATNTKCTSEAIRYSNCVKMKVIAWHYPHKDNLEYLIESKKLYPVSILPGLRDQQKIRLFEIDILTVQDLLKNTPEEIAKIILTDDLRANRVFTEAALLLS